MHGAGANCSSFGCLILPTCSDPINDQIRNSSRCRTLHERTVNASKWDDRAGWLQVFKALSEG